MQNGLTLHAGAPQDNRKEAATMHRKLEEMIAAAYDKAGFDEVILTPRSGDLGRDIIASRKDWGRVRFIDQVKAYKPGHLVTAEEVRALGFVRAGWSWSGRVRSTSPQYVGCWMR
jgi:hypothetical protein